MSGRIFFYVFRSLRGPPNCVLHHDVPMRFLKEDTKPIYQCELPLELHGKSLKELSVWYALGAELGGLPPPMAPPPAKKDPKEGAAKFGHRERSWCVGDLGKLPL